jgi:hypothetical protein
MRVASGHREWLWVSDFRFVSPTTTITTTADSIATHFFVFFSLLLSLSTIEEVHESKYLNIHKRNQTQIREFRK